MQRAVLIVNLTIAITALVVMGTYLITPPPSWVGSWASFHVPLGLNIITPCLHLGGAALFLLSLDAYKAKMRRAYTAIALGIIITAIGSILLPIISAFDLWESFIVTSGLVAMPLVLAGPITYAGARSFGLLVNLQSRLTWLRLVLPGIVCILILATFLPHAPSPNKEIIYDMSNTILIWSCLFDLLAALTVLRVKQRIGTHYHSAMAWLSAALFANFGILVVYIVDGLISPTSASDAGSSSVYLIGIIVGAIWLKAGYEFMKTRDI